MWIWILFALDNEDERFIAYNTQEAAAVDDINILRVVLATCKEKLPPLCCTFPLSQLCQTAPDERQGP